MFSLILDNSVTAIHQTNRSLTNSESLLGGLLFGHSNLLLVSSSDFAGLLGDGELNVAVAGEVW